MAMDFPYYYYLLLLAVWLTRFIWLDTEKFRHRRSCQILPRHSWNISDFLMRTDRDSLQFSQLRHFAQAWWKGNCTSLQIQVHAVSSSWSSHSSFHRSGIDVESHPLLIPKLRLKISVNLFFNRPTKYMVSSGPSACSGNQNVRKTFTVLVSCWCRMRLHHEHHSFASVTIASVPAWFCRARKAESLERQFILRLCERKETLSRAVGTTIHYFWAWLTLLLQA